MTPRVSAHAGPSIELSDYARCEPRRPPTAAHDAAMSPPPTRGRYCLGHIPASVQHWAKAWTSRLCHVRYAAAPLALPRPWGFNPPKTKKLEAGPKLQVPLPISWCRARDLNPHGKPIRPSTVRVCQFRQPGTDYRDHYRAPVRRAARRMKESSYSITA